MPRRVSVALAFTFLLSTSSLGACDAPETQEGIRRESDVFDDLGTAGGEEPVRAVVLLPVRERGALDGLARDIYDPASSSHRMFLDRTAVEQRFLPTEGDVARTRAWASSHGLEVHFVAANRLFVELHGNVRAFNDAFVTTLHAYKHRSREQRVYGTPGGVQMPDDAGIAAVLSLDETADGNADPDGDVATPSSPPLERGYLPETIAQSYGIKDFDGGRGGEGITIALVTGGAFRASDVRAFWKAVKVEREDAIVREIGGPPSFRGLESTMLAEWVGVLAPKSRVIAFQGTDTRSSSLLLAFNEAIGTGEAQIVAFSNSRHETSEPVVAREAFDLAAELGAITGATVLAASGDTAEADIPATCPFVTAVGGTTLVVEGTSIREEAWARSGSGTSSSFAIPAWQRDVAAGFSRRVTPDLALNAGAPYLVLYEGRWDAGGGTSIATPVLAGIIALVDAGRLAEGRKPLGFLNPTLYRDSPVRQTFRDVTAGGTRDHAASTGWDAVSGWGAPVAKDFAQATLDRLPH